MSVEMIHVIGIASLGFIVYTVILVVQGKKLVDALDDNLSLRYDLATARSNCDTWHKVALEMDRSSKDLTARYSDVHDDLNQANQNIADLKHDLECHRKEIVALARVRDIAASRSVEIGNLKAENDLIRDALAASRNASEELAREAKELRFQLGQRDLTLMAIRESTDVIDQLIGDATGESEDDDDCVVY